jgi:hypothetical protein
VIAIVFGFVLAITGFFPPNEKVFHWTIVMIVILFAFWSRRTAIIAIVVAVVGRLMGFVALPDSSLLQALIPGVTTSYIAIGIAVIGLVLTFMNGGESVRFEGIPEGDKIVQRQKMITEIEKQYGEGD